MKKMIFFILLVLVNICFAADIDISISPRNPVMGETFSVTFSIATESSDEPSITFNPLGAQVVSKGNTGISTRTTYINGKLSVERKMKIEYELLAQSSSEVFLRDIKVELGDKGYSLPTKRISVYKEPLETPGVFVKAHVDKKDIFVNESLVIRYYLYSKYHISNPEIKKFPKLEKFLKRYHDDRRREERVEFEGELYTRKVFYTAQVFAQSAGIYEVDPISMMVYYAQKNNDPFGGFGFGFQQMRKKTLISEPVKIKVKSLPVENIPKGFTGLVGKHEFGLKINKDKFLVNEPIEINLQIKGPGALESIEAPQIFSDANLEELTSDNDLKIDQDFNATKTFNMTYLGRGPVKIEKKKLPFSYFDPDQEKFITVYLDFNGVEVVGQALATSSKPSTPEVENKNPENITSENVVTGTKAFTPFYKLANTYVYQSKNIVIILLIILVGVLSYRFKEYLSNRSYTPPSAIQVIKRQGVNYSNLFSLLSLLRNKDDKDLSDTIKNSNLSNSAKSYFETLMTECEKEFQSNTKHSGKSVDKKYLAEIEKIIKKNESV